jgi:FdhD protein
MGMNPPGIRRIRLVKVGTGVYREEDTEVAEEAPFTVHLNGREWVTVLATPTDLEDLVVGILANEGIIRAAEEVTTLVVDRDGYAIWVRVPTPRRSPDALMRRMMTSCCGRSRPSVYFLNDDDVKPLPDGPPVSLDAVMARMADLDRLGEGFRRTGGLHTAGAADADRLVAVRTDVGRHNALDKLAGHVLRHGIDPITVFLVLSGRLSSEVVIKAARIGVPLVASRAAPTTLGLELADALNLTALGFVRPPSANVYTHPERLALSRR